MKRVFLALLAALLIGLPSARAEAETGLTVVFFGAEAADAILLYDGESAALIDAGLKKYGKRILSYMEAAGIDGLDLMIITHFDKDHVGGAAKILQTVPVARAVAADYTTDTSRYADFLDAAEGAGVAVERVSGALELSLGALKLRIDAADDAYWQENDLSLVVRAEYGACSFLFAGDAENPRLGELLGEGVLRCDLLKVPHHGRAERLSADFFDAALPRYAIVTSSEEEPEDEAVLTLLRYCGAEIFLTRYGDVVATCDGETVSVSYIADKP